MELTKLLPILIFSATSLVALTKGRVLGELDQPVLPDIPGYVPVYIQHGDVPPDVEAMYKHMVKAAHLKLAGPAEDQPMVEVDDEDHREAVAVAEAAEVVTERLGYENGYPVDETALPPDQPRPIKGSPDDVYPEEKQYRRRKYYISS